MAADARFSGASAAREGWHGWNLRLDLIEGDRLSGNGTWHPPGRDTDYGSNWSQ
jgi:hypothetical protein